MSEKYAVPAILSFIIPGLGQLLKKEYWKGLALTEFIVISTGISFILGAFQSWGIWILLIAAYIGIWFWAVYDAYN